MCPEDVSFVVRYVLCEFFMLHGTELLPGQVKIVEIDSNQSEFFYGPLDPVFDVGDIPLRRIWRKGKYHLELQSHKSYYSTIPKVYTHTKSQSTVRD